MDLSFFVKELIAFIQEADYTKDTVKAGTEYVKEYVIEQEGENQQQVNLDSEFKQENICFFCK